VTVIHGDCLEVLRSMPANSVDSVVTDPPAGIGFMNKHWDIDKGGRDVWIAWLANIMRECLRVVKPGGHAFVWSLPRTSHWTAMAIEDAGWEIRDTVAHIFGSGFPKSLDVSKAIDKAAGVEREVVGATQGRWSDNGEGRYNWNQGTQYGVGTIAVTAPATDAARQWHGWGTSLKPAHEMWILARKPLAAPNVAANVVAWNVGAINVAACRVGTDALMAHGGGRNGEGRIYGNGAGVPALERGVNPHIGRWPPNLVLSHSADCKPVGTRRVRTGVAHRSNSGGNTFGGDNPKPPMDDMTYADATGHETVTAFRCAPGCPVAEMDRQSGTSVSRIGLPRASSVPGDGWGMTATGAEYNDAGGSSRFFPVFRPDPPPFIYRSKASRADRERGLEDSPYRTVNDGRQTPIDNPYQRGETLRRNGHPTVKSVALMRWLVRLVTPRVGVCLDPFCGSGSTGVACVDEGMQFIGIERELEYVELARARIEAAETIPLLR
jgi:hypothetical protein